MCLVCMGATGSRHFLAGGAWIRCATSPERLFEFRPAGPPSPLLAGPLEPPERDPESGSRQPLQRLRLDCK